MRLLGAPTTSRGHEGVQLLHPRGKEDTPPVGVHVGDVVESGGEISGDAVNVASRVEPLAEDGGVCLSRQVYDQVQNKFELPMESLGMKSLKNVSLPTEVYKVRMPWEETRGAHQELRQAQAGRPAFRQHEPGPRRRIFRRRDD